MSEVLERALADLAEHPNSSALEISRRLGVLDDRRVFKVLDQAAYDGKCQRTRTGREPWRWEIPPIAGCGCCQAQDYEAPDDGEEPLDVACVNCGHSPEEHEPA